MNKRYYNMTMKQLLDLRTKKKAELKRLGGDIPFDDVLRRLSVLKEHLRLIEAEILSRVEQLPMFK